MATSSTRIQWTSLTGRSQIGTEMPSLCDSSNCGTRGPRSIAAIDLSPECIVAILARPTQDFVLGGDCCAIARLRQLIQFLCFSMKFRLCFLECCPLTPNCRLGIRLAVARSGRKPRQDLRSQRLDLSRRLLDEGYIRILGLHLISDAFKAFADLAEIGHAPLNKWGGGKIRGGEGGAPGAQNPGECHTDLPTLSSHRLIQPKREKIAVPFSFLKSSHLRIHLCAYVHSRFDDGQIDG